MDHHKKALWTQEEDRVLIEYVREHGRGKWNRIPELTGISPQQLVGLKRGGKSCRLRWLNYLSPNVKRGDFSKEEEDLIIRLHSLIGNRWSLIAGRVPGRTDNQVKNYWNTHLCKKLGLKKQARKTAMSSKPQTSNKMQVVHRLANNSELLKRSQDSELLRSNDPSSFSVGERFHDAREAYLQGNPETPLYDVFNWNSPAGLVDFLD